MLLSIIAATLFISERLAKAGVLSLVLARKLVHLVAVASVAISPLFFPNQSLLAVVIALFTALLCWAVATGKLAIDEQRHRKSWGIALFPLAFLVLLLPFGSLWPWLVVYPMLVLAIADPAAAIVGELTARRFYKLTGDRKSWPGSIAFFMSAAACLLWLPGVLKNIHPLLAWPFMSPHHWPTIFAVLIVAAAAALAEALGSGGTDNLNVPLITAWGMAAVGDTAMQVQLIPAAFLGLFFALAAYRRQWLDAGGAAAAALLGIVVWTSGGWQVALPLLLFFVSGSLLGKLPRQTITDAKHARPRDWMQVLANGGIAGILMWLNSFFPSQAWVVAAWVSVAISLSDTWSSEIGQWMGGKVFNIVGGRRMPAGLSGGISWQGSLGGAIGSLLLAVVGGLVLHLDVRTTVLLAIFGFSGMLVDSILGSICQAKYRGTGGELVESRQEGTDLLVHGWPWMTNDLVNLVSNLLVTLGWLILIA